MTTHRPEDRAETERFERDKQATVDLPTLKEAA